ncbi:MAG: LamG domain-containing protein, partial [Sedimentisphaerales bacterium]|nr:LamG domain-containing protein [Sedimentisphaerales bacterium]
MSTSKCVETAGETKGYWVCLLLLFLGGPLLAAGPDTTGLVLYLPMENAQNPIDASGDPTTVTVLGTLSLADGQLGTRGLAFNGNPANRLEIAHAPKLEGMSALTIEAWAYPQNIASHEGMAIVSKRIANQNGDAYNLFIWTGQIIEARVNAGGAVNSTTVLQNDNWYHIAYVFDAQAAAGEKAKLYVNGVLEDSGDHTATAAQGSNGGGAPVWIGELDSARGFPWDGILDEIGIWDIALTGDDVNLLMSKTKMQLLNKGAASNPTPADGAEDVLRTTDLGWTAGEFAATHNVYFGPSPEDVNAARPTALIAEGLGRDVTGVDVGALDFGQIYYWRVDEVNGAPDFAVLEGDLWSFTVEPIAYPVTGIVATSNGDFDAGAGPENTIDGSGLNAADQHSTEAGDMWVAYAP